MKRFSLSIIVLAFTVGYLPAQSVDAIPDTLHVSPYASSVFSVRNMDRLEYILGSTDDVCGSVFITEDSVRFTVSADLSMLEPHNWTTWWVLSTADHPRCRINAVIRPGWSSWPEAGDTLNAAGTVTVGGVETPVTPTIVVSQTHPYDMPGIVLSAKMQIRSDENRPPISIEAVLHVTLDPVVPLSSEFELVVYNTYCTAISMGYRDVSVEHALLASLRLTGSSLSRELNQHGINIGTLRQRLEHGLREESPGVNSSFDNINLLPQTEEVFFDGPHREAFALHARQTKLIHFLLSILRHGETPAANMLHELGLAYENVRTRRTEIPLYAAKITYLGNPFHRDATGVERYYASRSVHDMFLWNGKIYFGHGDWFQNTGPIPVISYDPATMQFQTEFIADGEAIERFRVADGKLVFPDIDPRDSWDYGNFYVLDDNGWRKVRTMPDGIHAFDIAWHNDTLFVAGATQKTTDQGEATIWRSANFGLTCDEFYFPADRVWRLFRCDDALYATTTTTGQSYRYIGTGFEPVTIDLFPGEINREPDAFRMEKLTSVGNRIVYISRSRYGYGRPSTGYFADRIDHIKRLEFPWNDTPFDFVARSDTLYAATYRFQDITQPYTVIVYRSLNLDEWEEVVRFTLPAASHPTSCEYDGEAFYLGCGQLANEHCGDIYRVIPPR